MAYQYRGKVHDLSEPLPTPIRPRRLEWFDPSACGTYAGYRRHQKHNVPACDDCKAAQADYSRDYEQRLKNGHQPHRRDFDPSACGTYNGYRRHMRAKNKPCDGCRAANTEYQRTYRAGKIAA